MNDQPNQESPNTAPPAAPRPDIAAVPKDHRTWALLAHLGGLLVFTQIPFGNVLGPLIVWLIKKDEMPFVDDQGKEALNFQITVTIALLAGIVIMAVTCLVTFPIVLPLMAVVEVVSIVFLIVGAIKANEGVRYRYPVCIRFIK